MRKLNTNFYQGGQIDRRLSAVKDLIFVKLAVGRSAAPADRSQAHCSKKLILFPQILEYFNYGETI